MTQAKLIISLSDDGRLQMELPVASGGYRTVLLRAGHEAATLVRVLTEREAGALGIGQDGAPTRAQVRHWENHETFPDSRCRFCRAEGRASGTSRAKRHTSTKLPNGVEIRRVAPGASSSHKPRAIATSRSIEDLGL